MITNYLSNSIVKGGMAPVFDTPADYGLDYEDVSFTAKDGVTLKGWLVKGGTDKIIVQSHFGIQSSRSGYSPDGKSMKMWPEKIHFLKHVKYLVDQGYSVLMYDFRNHGDSDDFSNGYCGWGPDVVPDVVAAVDFVANHETYKDAQIGLLSICMGAAASTYAFGQGALEGYNIKAMVAIQPMRYADFLKVLGLPGFLRRRVNAKNSERVGFELMEKSFVGDVSKISVPTLLVQNEDDQYLVKPSIDQFYNDLTVEKEMMWLSGIGKLRAAGYDYLTKSPAEILSWFDRFI
ncbi:MAG: alpha/beta fold hydrolase [Pseudomonadota bacterium]